METTTNTSGYMWKKAATDGLILSSVTIAVMVLNIVLNNPVTGVIFWIVKLVGSIWLLNYLMKQFGIKTGVQSTFGYGAVTCMFSALVCAAFTFLQLTFINPESITQIFDSAMQMFGSSLTSEQQDIFLKMEDNYAQYAFISTFIWDTLFGVVVSAIMAGSTSKKKDVFATPIKDDDDE